MSWAAVGCFLALSSPPSSYACVDEVNPAREKGSRTLSEKSGLLWTDVVHLSKNNFGYRLAKPKTAGEGERWKQYEQWLPRDNNKNRDLWVRTWKAAQSQPVSQFLAQLQFLSTNAWSIGNKEGELEVLVQSQGQDILGLSEMWWDGSQVWNAETNGYRLLRRDGQGRTGGVTLNFREGLNCMELGNGNGRTGFS